MKIQTCYSFICCLLLSSCAGKQYKPNHSIFFNNYTHFPYDLSQAANTFFLDDELREISALTYYDDDNLLCLNDENGIVFKYNVTEGGITDSYNFYDDGDYEGIEYVNGVLFILRSDSRIFQIRNFDKHNISVEKYKGPLSIKNDTEGLGYDAKTNSLLIACKAKPNIKGVKMKNKRSVYSFNLNKFEFSKKATYILDLEDISAQILSYDTQKIHDSVLKRLISNKELFVFNPSAIATHPLTGNIYMLSSVGKSLIVISPSNELLYIALLDKNEIQKPEGICFSPNGTMYISSEGKSEKASIRVYDYKAN